ncbi:MAG: glycosyltransferase family 4 protein [Flavobacteriales bacterium]|nr:glycosyltransferase family 4 protein [Flavobacteriales bacterium]
MPLIGISHKTRYWQHYCFSHPPQGYRYVRGLDIPWHLLRVHSQFLAHTKCFLPLRRVHLYHTYNGVVANRHPWVVEVESLLPRYGPMPAEHPRHRWALRQLAGHRCKALIFTSNKAMQLNQEPLAAAGVDPGKMHVVYRAVEQFAPQGRDPDRFTILFAGNGFYRKGGIELLKAFIRLNRPDARLVIISQLEVDWGVFPKPEVVAWAEHAIAHDTRITLHRGLPHGLLIGQMRAADLFVGTTFRDPFNNTVLEAMGCALPVICSDVGALPEVVHNTRNGWVLPVEGRTSDDIAEEVALRMRQLMDDRGLRERMGAANHGILSERFSLPVRNSALAQLYDRALVRP